MKIVELIRLLRKHIVLLLITPLIMAALVIYLTRKPVLIYSSQTTLYTGIASGTSVDIEKSLSFFATNTAFDNLINVIKSRETQQEVAIRLLAIHLMLDDYNPKFISKQSYASLKSITPRHVLKLVVGKNDKNNPKASKGSNNKTSGKADNPGVTTGQANDTTIIDSTSLEEEFSFSALYDTVNAGGLPPGFNRDDYEKTVENLKNFMASSDTNFVYKLLYFHHPHYSINAISKIFVKRIGNSDLVNLSYESNDPGVCQQTLILLTEVCIKNYKDVKENRSDAVVKYFEHQVKQAAFRLKIVEDKLLKFNMDNNIINYYEQSKAVAIVKENLEVSYHEMRIKVAGSLAAIRRLEEKLATQKEIQLNNSTIIENRKKLSDVNAKIATIETIDYSNPSDTINNKELVRLKLKAEKLKDELRNSVNGLYNITNSTEGLHLNTLLADWLKNVIEYEENKAGLSVLGDRIIEFQKQYSIYAPAGANIKRIEREINVSEQEFLELLHGLNLAKLKMQDAELSATIRAVDPPFFPLSANPTKRSMLVLVAAVFGFILVLAVIVALEYLDDSFKNHKKAEKTLKLKNLGIFPKVFLNTGSLNFPFVANRLLEMIIQNIGMIQHNQVNEPRTLVFFSTLKDEGKTTLISNLAQKLIKQGKTVLVLNYSGESLYEMETSQIGYDDKPTNPSEPAKEKRRNRYPIISRILGYPDPRIDIQSPFLAEPESVLDEKLYHKYTIDSSYFAAQNYDDLLRNTAKSVDKPDFVLIEIPNLLSYPFPEELVKNSIMVLVARANHVWSDADQNSLESIMKFTSGDPQFILNGVDLGVLETVLGDLPKKRSRFRRMLKKLVRLQFKSGYQP
ncbi:MAG: hypothetical protein JNL22_01120 [Bacteroidales bacterium]|nr:hypothetical protein [Bacteroidales bacterium]